MGYPKIEINLGRLEHNVRTLVKDMEKRGITVMGVNKAFNGLVEPAAAMVRGGIRVIAEPEINSLKKLKGLPCQKALLRIPALSQIEDVVKYADISLNSEIEVIRALSKEAVRQNTNHQILLMIDMGDIREGIWFENRAEIETVVQEIINLPHVELYGLGTNFNCFGSVKPTVENEAMLVKIARDLEMKFKIKIPYISGGNSTTYHLVEKGLLPEGINHLRMGSLFQFGIQYVDIKYLDGYFHSQMDVRRVASNLYIFKAEIIECNIKPTVPVGELGLDAQLKTKTFTNRGKRKRAVLAIGRQDISCEHIWPVDSGIEILGQSFNHTIIDIEDSKRRYKVGDIVEFEVDWDGLLEICCSTNIEKEFVY